uniref:Phosphotransferase n=1 Tax=Parascaris equorum TaxID=6256 RepID=A0A914RMC4_PAREQ
MFVQTRPSGSALLQGKLSHILTQFDHEIDDASVHKGKQMIDKLTGALYLGDLVRRILAQLVLDGFLFSGKPCEKLDEVDSFPTKFISEILALVIGVGGALIQFHPTYHVLLEEKLKALAPPDVKWQLVPADEGSAKGAAMLAAVVEKMGL